MIELKNSKIQYHGKVSGRDRYTLEAFIGAVQMREPGGLWQDIRSRLVRDDDGWHVEGAPYYAEIKDDGSRLFCPDRNEQGKHFKIPAPVLFENLARNVVSNPAKLDGALTPSQITLPTDWGEYRIIFTNTGMHFEILFTKSPPAAVFGKDSPRIILDAETAGFDIDQLLKSKSGLGIPRPRLITENIEALESEIQERWLNWKYKNGQLELGFDFGDLPFPILLKNTTVDVQVGAGADDGWVRTSGDFDNSGNLIYIGGGTHHYHAFFRMTGVTIPQSSTIDVCYYTPYIYAASEWNESDIYFEKAQNPDAVESYADYISRTLTSASVPWDGNTDTGFQDSPSLVTPMQELINAYGLSNQAVQVMHKDSSPYSGDNKYIRTYDYNSNYGAKLHVEYTAGGAISKTAIETGAGADASSLLANIFEGDTAGGSEGIKGRGVALKDDGGGADTLTNFLAGLLSGETGSGIEQSTLTSLVAKFSTEAGSGIDTTDLTAQLTSTETGTGADNGVIPGQKNLFDCDGGVAADALKTLIETSDTGSDIKLPGHKSHVRIPSKGVSL
jgi:hypothetical protein